MKTYKPQVQLVRKKIDNQPDEYFLHAVTFCEYTNIRANGHEALLPTLNDDGKYEVTLLAIEDASLPKFNYLTPIVHTISLGSLPFGDKDGDVVVHFDIEGGNNGGILSRGDKKRRAGSSGLSTTTSDPDSRPIS